MDGESGGLKIEVDPVLYQSMGRAITAIEEQLRGLKASFSSLVVVEPSPKRKTYVMCRSKEMKDDKRCVRGSQR